MKITIQGQDYTSALDAVHPLEIERKLNEPSMCRLWLSLPVDGSLAAPARFERLAVTGDDGTQYFTGYLAASPLPEYAGVGVEGPRYRYAVDALSDEILLDQYLMASSKGMTGESAGALVTALVNRTGSAAISTHALTLASTVSHFAPEPGAAWSKSAGQAAALARASYRAVNGALALNQVASTVHRLDEGSGSLCLGNLQFTSNVKRALANDVTVCGEHEPAAYVTEYFQGDGTTLQFYLSAKPYVPASSKQTIIDELFNEPSIDDRVWGALGGNTYLTLGAGGLAMNGGAGVDGQTLIEWLDPAEMGGTLLLEATGVSLSLGSTGILAGFFQGLKVLSGCTAGFQATAQQGTGTVTLQPILQGNVVGLSFTVNPANLYALRVRIHANESHRVQALYRSFGDDGQIAAGGDWNLTSAKVQMEVQEYVNGVGAMPVTLYDGSLANLPGTCKIVPASSLNLIGSMRSICLHDLGSAWVVSTPASGGAYTRRLGSTAQAAECHVERTGELIFYTGFAPANGEQIAVSYRTTGRAVGRAVNSASQAALLAAGSPSVATWIGSVTNPAARSSADCRNAASVIAQAAASVSALWSGTYKATQFSFATDVWPGDALELVAQSLSLDAQVIVRSVKLEYKASCPDLVAYTIAFANDWADDLAIKTSGTVPDDTWLPAPVTPTLLANLPALTVTALNGKSIAVSTGVTPPTGGGFEVRRRDYAFMAGQDSTLVLRSTVPNFTFARESANDRYYIRMYDGSTPPNYSEFSRALYINLPLG
ncbi:MAG: hypothetical protein P4L03_08410 [Terracidiphilus sp.]|nr:hypothetical protein [Terracidiphilus sp.]